jgi:cytosolic carboxypeptidase protein 2/3
LIGTLKFSILDCQLIYDSFAKINTKLSDFSKKFLLQKSLAIYFKLLENNKKPFHSEKSSLPFQKSNSIDELGGINALPKNRFFPLFQTISIAVDEETIFFDSKFESGNLRRVYRISPNEYNLLLEFDVGTENYSQWFFFRVFNIRKDLTIKMNIINLIKPNNFYNEGQQPRVFSDCRGCWSDENCQSIVYSKSDWKKLIGKTKLPYYTLSFSYTFAFANDCTYFAHCYPYTYTDLVLYLRGLERNWKNSETACLHKEKKNLETSFYKMFKLTQTDIGNDIFVLELGNPKKPKIILTGRVHPGESNGSLVIKGIIDSLIEGAEVIQCEKEQNQNLFDEYSFVIIPMLNPDGVRYGNYRCGLGGWDMNRRWNGEEGEVLTVVKDYIKKINDNEGIALFCDIHGHSKSKDVFLYGCNVKDGGEAEERNAKIKAFPFLLSKVKDHFCFQKCSFK